MESIRDHQHNPDVLKEAFFLLALLAHPGKEGLYHLCLKLIYILYIPTIGKRRPGRPRTSYLNYVQRLLGDNEGAMQEQQIAAFADDRCAWRNLVVACSAADGWWWWWFWNVWLNWWPVIHREDLLYFQHILFCHNTHGFCTICLKHTSSQRSHTMVKGHLRSSWKIQLEPYVIPTLANRCRIKVIC